MIAQFITLVATTATTLMILRARPAVRHTTLTSPWIWAVIAAAAWCIAAAASLVLSPTASAVGQLWYVAAVLTLCPWIAVLGARRPTIRVWNAFVVVPLIAVLLWPVALCWMPRGPDRLILETPHLVGFGLVLIMGTGNYFGTRLALLALLTLISEVILLASLGNDPNRANAPSWRLMASALIGAAVVRESMSRQVPRGPRSWNDLWHDFRDTFGIVWANRLAERVNAEAAKDAWSVRLFSRGFISTTPGQPPDLTVDDIKIEHTLRWLLRRFVDDEWINSRLEPHVAPGLNEGGSLAGNDSIDASSTLS